MQVTLDKYGKCRPFGFHQIFLPCFVANVENKPTIYHIDRNPANNRITNLRYATRAEQQ